MSASASLGARNLFSYQAHDLATQSEAFSLVGESRNNQSSSDAEHRLPDIMPVGPAQFVAGWAHYRAGNYRQAIERLKAAKEMDDPRIRELNKLAISAIQVAPPNLPSPA